jgi:hypothetical protein
MNIESLPIGLIIFILTQTAMAVWAIIKLYFAVEGMKIKVLEIEKENHDLKKQLKDMSDTLLLVKHSVDLLVLGRLKTGNVKEN